MGRHEQSPSLKYRTIGESLAVRASRGKHRRPIGSGRPGPYSLTVPSMQVTVPPPTQTWPSPSWEMCTRPRRPIAVPWLATYGAVTRPVLSSHWASEAFRLPVTGSSMPEICGLNARTSSASGEPAGYGPATPISISSRPGRIASTASALASRTATQPGPLSGHSLGDWLLDRAAAHQRRGGEGQAGLGPPDRDQPGVALLHNGVGASRAPARLQPRMAGAQRGVPGERELAGGREDPDPVVCPAGPRRQHERRLRQVRPARGGAHLIITQAVGTQHDR